MIWRSVGVIKRGGGHSVVQQRIHSTKGVPMDQHRVVPLSELAD